MTRAADNYFAWLLEAIDFDEQPIYWRVLDRLFHTPFTPKIFRDENRASDGLVLRNLFEMESGEHGLSSELMPECSVLEMMIALARRIEYGDLHDPDYGDRSPQWFWHMIKNLGLDQFTDHYYDDECVEMIVDNFIERRYDRRGRGSLFTVSNPRVDMRKTELWYQAQYWMTENFD